MTRTIELTAFALAMLIAALAVHAWLASRDDQRRLESTLAAQKQLIDAASARETSRDATLQQTLAQIDALKRAAQTPAEILRDLPKYLSLPVPIALAPPAAASAPQLNNEPQTGTQQGTGIPRDSSTAGTASPPTPASTPAQLPSSPPAPVAEIPAADLKPLYDYVQDCRACQARLAAAIQNASDDTAKISALTRARDAAVTASKGGTFWQRLRRNALWLAVGAGLGYAAHR